MVAVMQAAHVRPRDDLARGHRLDGPTHRRILTQRQMRAPVMVKRLSGQLVRRDQMAGRGDDASI